MNQALIKLNEALIALEKEALKGEGAWVFVSAQQLEMFRSELKRMLTNLEAETLPPKAERLSGMGRVIVDSWPLGSSLGETIIDAERAYKAA